MKTALIPFLKSKAIALLLAAVAALGGVPQAQAPAVNPVPVHVATVRDALDAGLLKQSDLAHPANPTLFGATGLVPQTAAFFETYLVAGIGTTDTSFTLASNLTVAGTALATGTYSFVIDQGSPSQEVVECSLSGATASACLRGIDPQNPNATSSAVTFPHTRAADVKITDYTFVGHVGRILNGQDTLPSILTYNSGVTNAQVLANGQNLVNVNTLGSTSIAGAIPANPLTGAAGIGMFATQVQTASGTPTSSYLGSTYYLFPWNGVFNASSTATTTVPVTSASGTLQTAFINQAANANYAFLGGVSIVSSTVSGSFFNFGSSTLASTTFTQIPTAPTSTPTLVTQLTTKNYVLSVLPAFGNSTTTVKTFAGGNTYIATSTITLAAAGRVLVIGSGSMSNGTGGDGCSITIQVDNAAPSDAPIVSYGIAASTPSAMPMSIFYITASLTAATHNIQLTATNVTGGTCTPANYTFQTQYIGP